MLIEKLEEKELTAHELSALCCGVDDLYLRAESFLKKREDEGIVGTSEQGGRDLFLEKGVEVVSSKGFDGRMSKFNGGDEERASNREEL